MAKHRKRDKLMHSPYINPTPQKPMKQRAEEMLAELRKYESGRRVHFLDDKVLKHLIKKGEVKLVNMRGFGSLTSHRHAVAAKPAPKVVEDTREPYAKRKAAMEEAGLNHRGKNWGKKRVDLPRLQREIKLREREITWKKLRGEYTRTEQIRDEMALKEYNELLENSKK